MLISLETKLTKKYKRPAARDVKAIEYGYYKVRNTQDLLLLGKLGNRRKRCLTPVD